MVSSLEFAVRVRPPFNQQEAERVGLFVDPSSERIVLGNNYSFTADHLFTPYSSQAVIYERFAPKVRRFLEGYDVSFITFGRSKSGKTHTLVGPVAPNSCEGLNDGLITRTALLMFDYLNKAKQASELNFNVFFSFFDAPSEDIVDLNRFYDVPHQKASMEQPMNNNFSSKECHSFDDVMNCVRAVMKSYPFERSYSHTNCFFMLTLHQQLMQSGKMLAKSSRCTFIKLGSNESFGLNNQAVQQLRLPNSGLHLISKVLSAISEEVNSSQITQPFSVLSALLKDVMKYSSATVLLFCVSPSSLETSNSLIDLSIIKQLRLLYGNGLLGGVYPNIDKRSPVPDVKLMGHHERDSFKEEALSLEFAASQWQLLVSNAEVLFNKLVQGGLSPDAKGLVEQWLFLKQECEDCFKPGAPGQEKIKCSLDRIDEVTESDGKTSLENSGESELDNDDSDELDDNNQSELTFVQSESKKREFTLKLETHLDRFRALTDQLVCEQYNTKFTRMYNEPKTTETKHLGLNKKAASVESLLQSADNYEGNSSSNEEDMLKLRQVSDSTSKQINPAGADVIPDGDMLRVEIASLRVTKDYLHEQKRELTVKMNETKYITKEEHRKLIEADEAIDAIDSAMEFKNELLCGRKGLPKTDLQEKGEQMLTERLLNLSPHEMRILLCKYFKKVVDLREAGRKMEKVIADQDHQLETQAFRIHALGNALQQTRVDCERRLIMVRKEQEKKYQLNIHHFATDSSGASSSVDNKSDNLSSNTGPLFELNGGATSNVPDKALTAIPQQNLKKLQGSSTHTTKVTRKGNKLIIQQERSKKK
ncbi:hypothetical protein GE061_000790 [Apolygus lucorum]|uniref:Kinesin motor domain-containing protein n=1 Tax=Apolygus lucorum TaxID=248454 RepID=A0A8S9Y7G4_APOLU|nr:hypothetical protein GE061_000790 [Apolygus lucorum]